VQPAGVPNKVLPNKAPATSETDPCSGCAQDGGPAGGCYWPSQLSGASTDTPYWSSSEEADASDVARMINFSFGYVYRFDEPNNYDARCVRQ
jgi:hypothetical protein